MVKKVWDDPEIYRIYVDLPENPLRLLNVYVVQRQRKSLIIDTGFNRPECHKALWNGIRELDLDLSEAALFLTHLHTDHTGLVWSLVERGVPVYMNRIDDRLYNSADGHDSMSLIAAQFRQEGYPAEEMARQYTGNQGLRYAPKAGFPVIPVDDGTDIYLENLQITAIHTPGHTPGHMVLYLPEEQILFSGDHILFDITPNISVWGGDDHSLSAYISSLLKIRALPIRMVFPAHREAGEDVYRRIDQLIEHHGWRLNEIYEAVRAHPGLTAYALSGHITWSAHGRSWEEFPSHQKWFATSETLAHLDYLTEKGQVYRKQENAVACYYPSKR